MPVFKPTEDRDKPIPRTTADLQAVTIVAQDCRVLLLKETVASVELGGGPLLIIQGLVLDPEWTHIRIDRASDSSVCALTFHAVRS